MTHFHVSDGCFISVASIFSFHRHYIQVILIHLLHIALSTCSSSFDFLRTFTSVLFSSGPLLPCLHSFLTYLFELAIDSQSRKHYVNVMSFSLTSPSWNAFWNSVVFSSIERRFLRLEWWLPQTTSLTQPAILMRRTILLQLATLRHRLTILALRTMAPANGNGSFKQEFLFEQRFFCN